MGELSYQVSAGRKFNEHLRPVVRDLSGALDPIDYAISHCQRKPTASTIQAIRDRIGWAMRALQDAERTLYMAYEAANFSD